MSLVMRALRKLVLTYVAYTNQRLFRKAVGAEKRVVREILGSKMFLDTSVDNGLCRYLLIAGRRESYITDTMARELDDAHVVVDVGANVGYYALLESKVLAEKGQVFAIEPVPDSIALLKENISLNGYENIELHQTAIGDKTGTARMYVGKWLNRSQLQEVGSIADDLISHEIETPVVTLDDFLADKPFPDIIRMDVEGFEYNIFKGMQRILKDEHPLRIFVEFHFRFMGREKAEHLLRMLKGHGFEIGDMTYEVDEKCITRSKKLEDLAAYLNSKVTNVPRKGHLRWTIDNILMDAEVWKGVRAWEMCMRLGTLEIMFKRVGSPAAAVGPTLGVSANTIP